MRGAARRKALRATAARLALAAVGVGAVTAAPAFAQTGMTPYGNLDVALSRQSGGATLVDRGYNNWLGVRGEEDLGAGLAATMKLETRFMPDSGALERPLTFWQGESTVGLKQAGVGSVRVGRAMTPLWISIWEYEPWSNSAFNASLAAYQTGAYTSDGVFDTERGFADFSRISDGVFLDSEAVGGVRLGVATQVERPAPASRRAVSAALNVARGRVKAMASSERNRNGDRIHALAASYAFGRLTVMGSVARTRLLMREHEWVGVAAATYAWRTGTLRAGYGRNSASGHHKVGLGYVHPLSVRTGLYADVFREQAAGVKHGYAIGMTHTF